MTSAAGEKSPSPGKFTVVGTRPLRHDGLDKVTGHARYGADVHLPGLLHGKVLRSPHAHARIRAIDTSKAEALPGVQAVATARDFPIIEDRVIDLAEVQGNARLMAENILAHDKALYKGHAVAAVAATSTQGPFAIRTATAAILNLPESMVTVIPMEIGGGFGAKLVAYLDPVAALLSRKSGRPVKIVMDRKEVFEGTGPTSATSIRCKIGATRDGHITAAQLWLAYEAGAFPGSPVGGGALTGLGPYKIDNLLVDGYDVVVNKQKVQAYRAPGQPQAAFAVEVVIDELAEQLGMDVLEFRLKNAVQEGDRMPNGVPHPRIGCQEVLEAMRAHPHYHAPLAGPKRGRGPAAVHRVNRDAHSSATMHVNADGTISLLTGSVDIGGTRTSVAMQAAEVLGLRAEDVRPTVVDTDSIGYTGSTGGSRTTYDTGLAAIAAAEEVNRQMQAPPARIWEVQAEDVEFRDGVLLCTQRPEDRVPFKELARQLNRTGGRITCAVSAPSTGVGSTFAGNIVDVEVDPETGKVQILRYTAIIDAGQAVHPSYVEGQVQGSTVQGIGWALNEEYVYTEDGTMAKASFLDYRMPTTLDMPMIEAVSGRGAHPTPPPWVGGGGGGA